MFGWWFGLNEAYPRGQRSASMMVSEVGLGDAWYRAFEAPHLDKFDAPTVEGVDFPSLGIYQAWNDTGSGALHVGTYAAAPDRRGLNTSWRVTNLPSTDEVFILCDGEPFGRFSVDGPNAIRLDATIDLRHYQIFTGYRGPGERPAEARRERPGRSAAATGAGLAGGRPPLGEPPAGRRRERDEQLLAERTELSLLRRVAGRRPIILQAPSRRGAGGAGHNRHDRSGVLHYARAAMGTTFGDGRLAAARRLGA